MAIVHLTRAAMGGFAGLVAASSTISVFEHQQSKSYRFEIIIRGPVLILVYADVRNFGRRFLPIGRS